MDEQQAVFAADTGLVNMVDKQACRQPCAQLPEPLVDKHGVAYKCFFWHCKPDGTQPRFVGHAGQTVLIDVPSQTVVVQTAVDDFGVDGQQLKSLLALFQAAVAHGSQ